MVRRLLISFLIVSVPAFSQENATLEVHFLYGSRPAKGARHEKKWFGGIHGGHVGVASPRGGIVNFMPMGRFHVFSHRKRKHSAFGSFDERTFYAFMGGHPDSMKRQTIFIPVTSAQEKTFDSLARKYITDTPYDYAFLGMRCGAAAYDLLAHCGIVPRYSKFATVFRIFYPKRLRKKLIKLSEKNGWDRELLEGSAGRKWERD